MRVIIKYEILIRINIASFRSSLSPSDFYQPVDRETVGKELSTS